MGTSRTFAFLGPNDVDLSVVMGGVQVMDDGTNMPVWGFRATDGSQEGFNGDRVVPSPVIELVEGEAGSLILNSGAPHTIHLHGMDVDQANDGVPSTSGFVAASPGPFGNNFGRVGGNTHLPSPHTYTYVAPHAGTYLYHCHVDTALHMEYGMAGTIIVRPPGGSATLAYTGGPTFAKEYVWHLHSYDSRWHTEVVSGLDPTPPETERITARYRPDYFMINGKDTRPVITDPTVALSAAGGEDVLIRITHMGHAPASVRLGGLNFDVIASDGRPAMNPVTTTELLVTPGERYDILLTMPADYNGTATVRYRDIRLSERLLSDGFEDPPPNIVTTTVTGGPTP